MHAHHLVPQPNASVLMQCPPAMITMATHIKLTEWVIQPTSKAEMRKTEHLGARTLNHTEGKPTLRAEPQTDRHGHKTERILAAETIVLVEKMLMVRTTITRVLSLAATK